MGSTQGAMWAARRTEQKESTERTPTGRLQVMFAQRSPHEQHAPPGTQLPPPSLLAAAAAAGAGPHWNSPKCRERSPMTSKCLPSQLSPTMAADFTKAGDGEGARVVSQKGGDLLCMRSKHAGGR